MIPVTPDEAALRAAPLVVEGRLHNASNYTLLVRVVCDVEDTAIDDEVPLAVYKPRQGERPLWDFPAGTLCQREVAAYAVSAFLGWDIVPATVLRDGPAGEGSVQAFVPHDPTAHYFTLVEDPTHHTELARLAVFDLLCNNADRKGSHVLRDDAGRLVGIDHGLCFHAAVKLRTVIWDLGAYRLPESWRADVKGLASALADPGSDLTVTLAALLDDQERAALAARAAAVAELDCLPAPPDDRRPYPWPPL